MLRACEVIKVTKHQIFKQISQEQICLQKFDHKRFEDISQVTIVTTLLSLSSIYVFVSLGFTSVMLSDCKIIFSIKKKGYNHNSGITFEKE